MTHRPRREVSGDTHRDGGLVLISVSWSAGGLGGWRENRWGAGAVRILSDLISWADVSQITSRVGGVQAE